MRQIALDLGLRKIVLAERDAAGMVQLQVLRGQRALKAALGGNKHKAQVAFEACTQGWALAKWLRREGHAPLMVDTTQVARIGIGHRGRKNDEIDAELLLLALERDLLPLAHVASDDSQRLRVQLNIRAKLVETRASLMTAVRQLIRSEGEEFDRSYDGYRIAVVLAEADLTSETRALIAPLVSTACAINAQLKVVETKIEQLSARQPEILRLCTVPGVGPVVATTFAAVLDDPKRFANAHKVQSFLGLVPSESSSGGQQRLGRITKAGNSYLRSLLVQSAWSIMHGRNNHDNPLRVWAESVAAKRGKPIAMVALARRLAGILWAVWKSGTVYEAARLAAESHRGLRQQAQAVTLHAEAMAKVADKIRRHRASWNRLLPAQ